MIKVTIEKGNITEVIWVDSIEKISQVNTSLTRQYFEQVKDYSEELYKLNEKAMYICEEEADGALDKLQQYIDTEHETDECLKKVGCDDVEELVNELRDKRDDLQELERQASRLGYDDVGSALDELEENGCKLDDLDNIASGLGYNDAEDALNALDEMKSAMSEIYDLSRQFEQEVNMDKCENCLNRFACSDDDKYGSICTAYEKTQRWSSSDVTPMTDDSNKNDIKE